MPRRFCSPIELGEMRTSVRITRTVILNQEIPKSMAAVHEMRLRLVDSLEAAVDLIEAAQESIHHSWKAFHALDKMLKAASPADDESGRR
jgi:hypothetical protein